jgi:hypothetical protein
MKRKRVENKDSCARNTGLDCGRTGVLKRFGARQMVQSLSFDAQHQV